MILKSAINNYLKRPVDDHRWMKQLGHREIDALIDDLRPRPKLTPGLRLHQKIAFYLGVTYPQFSFWLDMGSGKTLVTLELIRYWFQFGEFDKALVFVLSDKAFPTWENQIREFKIGIPSVALEGSSEEKWYKLHNFKKGIILATYPGALAMCSVKGTKKKGKRMVSGLVLHADLINDLCDGVGVLALDESTKVGHSTSMLHKMVNHIAKQVEYRYALAGRPFGRDPTLMYNQQLIIDRGETFGLKGMFQAAFFSKERNHFGGAFSHNFKYKKSLSDELSRMMQHRSITYAADECVDLPKVSRLVASVKVGKTVQSYYNEALKALAKSKGDKVEVKNIFIRMRQMTSGFIGYKDDETGEKATFTFDTNPKLEKLLDLIEELPYERKAVIFYEFTWSAKQINEQLKKLGHKHIWLWSGTKNSRAELERFEKNPDYRLAVIQNKVGAYSIDGLQKAANYGFIYESPISVIDREQLEHRLIRQGQKHKVFLYDLVVPKSVDERILEFHAEGQDIMAAVRKNPNVLKW